MSLLIYLDVESLGLDSSKTGLTQLAAIIVRGGSEMSRINLDINTFSYSKEITVSKKALKLTGKTVEGIKRYPSATFSYFKFTSWLDAHREIGEYYTLICYKTPFDLSFLEGFFKDQVGSERRLYDYFHYKTLDIFDSVKLSSVLGVHKTKNDKLETLCNYYNIPIKAHCALEDIVASRKVYKKILGGLGVSTDKLNIL